ncbi:hypothetical protein [Burkholderia contaminans]|uniref:hypothetical protein n=1 Tax=Burkholderia contaminans TaxID=488447 RepID=UPI001452F1BF|nr:hypothetical protein [Burkholderia contaminans]VWD20642.1 hypothetical protein BCO18442_03892 [Burkholderia contaminans]
MTRKGSVTGKSASNRIELTGRKIGRLEVLAPHRKEGVERLFYECRCECGNLRIVGAQTLRLGTTQSCGCLQKERTRQASLKHGMSRTSIHNVWSSMLQRCNDAGHHAYPDYGGRGIKVCDRWLTFENFLADMGLPPQKGLTLDRFPNNDGNYEPGNVRWATKKEQANNRRSSRILVFNGESMTIAQWEDRQGFRRGLINTRLQDGWTVERAITQKPRFDDS